NDGRHTNAIATHEEGDLAAGLVQNGRLHGHTVFLAQLEDMADLDAARDLQASLARGAGISFHYVAKIRCRWAGDVPFPVRAHVVHIFFVRAGDEVGHRQCRVIHVDPAAQADDANVAGLGAGRLPHILRARHLQRTDDTGQLLRLDGVELVITADDEGDHRVIHTVDNQRLQTSRRLDLQKARQVFDGLRTGRRDLLELLHWGRPRLAWRQRDGGFQVSRVVITVREGNRVFARVGEDVEL